MTPEILRIEHFSVVQILKSVTLPVSACCLILAAKLALIWRININWDEFYFLNHVYEYVRGEQSHVFQMAYVHGFSWLPWIGSDEIDQVIAARILMWGGLAATVVLIARLARRWVSPGAAWFAPLAFLAVSPVQAHGASFRADSLLVPLSLLTLVIITSPRPSRMRIAMAGCLFGVSLAVSLKAVLLAPAIIMLILCDWPDAETSGAARVKDAMLRVCYFGIAATLIAGTMLFLHSLSLPSVDSGSVETFGVNVARKTIFEATLFPQWDYLQRSLVTDWVSWAFIFCGLFVALVRFRPAAICALSLLPLLFYRNSYPYYYVVMVAPAAVLAAVAVDALRDLAGRASPAPGWIAVAASLPLILQAGINLSELRFDRQENQRLTIAAVHQIFPLPVPYIDHSGMIASFPKVNFFMSTWGIDDYLNRGLAFMQTAIDIDRPPMLLANKAVLMPGSGEFMELLEEDRRLIEKYYVPYWGAIRIAGADIPLDTLTEVSVDLPFPGHYRVETEGSVIIDGAIYTDGSILEIPEGATGPTVSVRRMGTEAVKSRLIWADAGPPPAGALPPFVRLYSML